MWVSTSSVLSLKIRSDKSYLSRERRASVDGKGGGQGHTRTPFVPQVLFRRAADVLGIDEARISDDSSSSGLCEPIQLVHYAPGQKYDASTAERAR